MKLSWKIILSDYYSSSGIVVSQNNVFNITDQDGYGGLLLKVQKDKKERLKWLV